jgi:hypothetical protein
LDLIVRGVDVVKLENYTYGDKQLQIEICLMDYEDILEWDEIHQPLIKNMTERADSTWNWKKNYYLLLAAKKLGQKPQGYVIRAEGVILGMTIIAFNYPCEKEGKKIYPYLWYMTKSPLANKMEEMIGDGEDFRFLLANLFYDLIERESIVQQLENSSCLWLHSDSNGGDELYKKYISSGFEPCDFDRSFSIRGIFYDDNRYLYYDNKKNRRK